MKKLAILGDSYSTYEGYVSEQYPSWYGDKGNSEENDVISVTDTWWKIFCDICGYDIILNCSFSGSSVCYSGYPELDGIRTSFLYRMYQDFSELRLRNEIPDLIILFGGTNDYWNDSPIGNIRYCNQKSEDLYFFAPAFCSVVEYLRSNFPDSMLVNVLNDDISSTFKQVQLEVCAHYSITVIELEDIAKQNGHPSKKGMQQISNQIIKVLYEKKYLSNAAIGKERIL